jgi:hypothetical protein
MKDPNIDFKGIWQKQQGDQPALEQLRHKLKAFKKYNMRKILICNILLVVSSSFIILIWYYFQPQFITTKIGIVMTVLAMLIFILSYNKLYSSFKKIDNTQNNSEYLRDLTLIKTRQKHLETKMLSAYFILLSIGICLYLYEYTIRMSLFWGILAYAITLAWIGFNWFYLRPRAIKKQNLKIDGLINKVKSLKDQLEKN